MSETKHRGEPGCWPWAVMLLAIVSASSYGLYELATWMA